MAQKVLYNGSWYGVRRYDETKTAGTYSLESGGQTGKRAVVLAFHVSGTLPASGVVSLNTETSTVILAAILTGAGGGAEPYPFSPVGWAKSVTAKNFQLVVGTGGNVHVHVDYIWVDEG